MAHINTLKYTLSQVEMEKIPLNLGLPSYTHKMSTIFQSKPLFISFKYTLLTLNYVPLF